MGFPRECRPAGGTCHTFNQWHRPDRVKIIRYSWADATKRCSTQSSSLVPIPWSPRPPRFWAR